MNSVNLGSGVHFFQEYGADNFIIEKPHMPFHLGGRTEAIRLVKAILAALGEPVEEKPDRSELDAAVPWRFIAIEDDTREVTRFGRTNADLDGLVAQSTLDTPRAVTIYEAVAHIAPRPEPAERKVVRL